MTPGEKAKAIVDEAVKGMNVILEVTGNNRHFAVTEDTVYWTLSTARRRTLISVKTAKSFS